MARDIKITRLTVIHYQFEVDDLGLEEKLGFDTVYQPGSTLPSGGGSMSRS